MTHFAEQGLILLETRDHIGSAIENVRGRVTRVPTSADPQQLQAASDLMGNLVIAGNLLRGGPNMQAVNNHVADLRAISTELYRDASQAMGTAMDGHKTATGGDPRAEVAACLERINRAATVLSHGRVAAAPKPWLNKIGGLLLGLLVGGGGAAYFGPTNQESTPKDTIESLNTPSSTTAGTTASSAAVPETGTPQPTVAPSLNLKNQGY